MAFMICACLILGACTFLSGMGYAEDEREWLSVLLIGLIVFTAFFWLGSWSYRYNAEICTLRCGTVDYVQKHSTCWIEVKDMDSEQAKIHLDECPELD